MAGDKIRLGLLEAAPGPKHKAALSVAYGAGLRAMEVVALKVCDIDTKRMMLGWSRAKAARACPREGGGSFCHAVAAAVGAVTRLVAHRASRGVDIPRPRPHQPDDHAPIQSRLPHGGRAGRAAQMGGAAHAAAQLCHPSAGTGYRHPRHPSAARGRDILPTNTQSKGGFTIRFIPGAARPCSLPGNMPTVVLNWSLFRSPTGRSPAYRCG